ncbi:MAG: hypothetical protein AAFQ80_01450 [Cyanobacteria bacterium J06621_8]
MESPSNSQLSPSIPLETVSSWIQLEKIKIAKGVSVTQKVRFALNLDLLEQITQIRQQQQVLSLPPGLLNQLRYYALLNSPLEQGHLINYSLAAQRSHQLGLTFDTAYPDLASGRSQTMLRSVIEPQGKISQLVRQDLSQNPALLEQLTTIHYWLIAEIMAQLPCKPNSLDLWLISISFMLIASIICLFINYYFSLSLLINLIIIIIVLGIFQIHLKSRFIKWLKSWLIYHLVVGWLVKSSRFRDIALRFIINLSF